MFEEETFSENFPYVDRFVVTLSNRFKVLAGSLTISMVFVAKIHTVRRASAPYDNSIVYLLVYANLITRHDVARAS